MLEDNNTITISTAEYRSLVKTNCEHDIMLGLLIDCMELDYSKEKLTFKSGRYACDIIEQFAPRVVDMKRKSLFDEEQNND